MKGHRLKANPDFPYLLKAYCVLEWAAHRSKRECRAGVLEDAIGSQRRWVSSKKYSQHNKKGTNMISEIQRMEGPLLRVLLGGLLEEVILVGLEG